MTVNSFRFSDLSVVLFSSVKYSIFVCIARRKPPAALEYRKGEVERLKLEPHMYPFLEVHDCRQDIGALIAWRREDTNST